MLASIVSFQKVSILPPLNTTEGHWKFLGGGGVLEAKLREEKYDPKLEFPGGREV